MQARDAHHAQAGQPRKSRAPHVAWHVRRRQELEHAIREAQLLLPATAAAAATATAAAAATAAVACIAATPAAAGRGTREISAALAACPPGHPHLVPQIFYRALDGDAKAVELKHAKEGGGEGGREEGGEAHVPQGALVEARAVLDDDPAAPRDTVVLTRWCL